MARLCRQFADPRNATALVVALALVSCAEAPTAPERPATVHRTVTVVVRDGAGVPAANAELTWTAQFDSAGAVQVIVAETDEDGECAQVLAQGGWIVTVAHAARVAGASFVVTGASRAPADTQLVRLTTHAPSLARGTVTLAGRADHAGTIVAADIGGPVVTGATGAWSLGGLPVGRWAFTARHPGYEVGLGQIVVTTPGSTVTVPAMRLVSAP